MKTYRLSDFVTVGECLLLLRNPRSTLSDKYIQEINTFLSTLDRCDLPNTKAVADSLRTYKYPFNVTHNRFTNAVVQQLKTHMSSVAHALHNEVADRNALILKSDLVTSRLRQLRTVATLTSVQQHLLDETMRCIEVESYRAAVIMGWNLIYDYVRQWIFDNKLSQFQNHLQTMYPKKTTVKKYQDFFASDNPLTEYEFLNVLRGRANQANIVRDRVVEDLVHYLRQRNNYAHPNFTMPSAHKTNAFIECLLDVISEPPFSKAM